jgi:YbgC/YbaW family acyl-CoA thioester hydrolase
MAYEYQRTHRVEFSETDMAGIVHFAKFFTMMENTEHAFFRSLGFSVHPTEGDEIVSWPRVNATCDYLRPLRFEEEVTIQLFVAEVRPRSIRYVFRFWKEEGGGQVEVARGALSTVSARVDPLTGKIRAVAIPPDIRAAIEAAPTELLTNSSFESAAAKQA